MMGTLVVKGLMEQSKEIKQKWVQILAVVAKVLLLERRLGTRVCFQPGLRFSPSLLRF